MNCTLQTLSSEAKAKPDKADVAELRAKVSCDFYHPTTCTIGLPKIFGGKSAKPHGGYWVKA